MSQQDAQIKKKKKWYPLESNPSLMNKYLSNIGVTNTNDYCFCDVFGFDDDLLAMVPQPVKAVMFLFPITKETEQKKHDEGEQIKKAGQIQSSNLFFLKQTIGNACGTVGIIHAVANNTDCLQLQANSFIADFLTKANTVTPDARASLLEDDDRIEQAHSTIAHDQSNASMNPEQDIKTNLHFVCFVHKDGCLYEMDGRRDFPINRGPSSADTLLYDAIQVIKQYMAMNPTELNFGVVALASA